MTSKRFLKALYNSLCLESLLVKRKDLLGVFADCLRKVKFIPCFYSMHFIDYQKFFRSDEGLTLETSAFQSLYGGQFTLSTLLINQIFVYQKFCSFETSSFQRIRSTFQIAIVLRFQTLFLSPRSLSRSSQVHKKNNIISPRALSKMYAIKQSHPN